MDDVTRLQAINKAIALRDQAPFLTRDELYSAVTDLGKSNLFSKRQIAQLAGHAISSSTISVLVSKSAKTGGRVSPLSLEFVRDVLIAKMRGVLDYEKISKILLSGTSQNMVARLTGIPQGTISRKIARDE